MVDAMRLYRLGRRLARSGVPVVPEVIRKFSQVLNGAYIPNDAEIGEATEVGYGGNGIVIHKDARVGRGCLISQQVTLGGRSGRPGAPFIGDFVRIGAGAKILGAITIGDYAVIGANAVVIKDVPAGAVVAGVPAREIRVQKDPVGAYRREMGREHDDQPTVH